MVDVSRSRDTINRVQDFILSSLGPFRLGKEGVRVAILSYSSTAQFELRFRDGTTKKAIQEALRNLAPREGGRRVDVALYQSVVEWRNGLPRNVIVFVDGPVVDNLRYLKQMVIYLIRRGLQLNFIATKPVNKPFIDAVTTASSRLYILPPDASLNQYLSVVIPSVTRAGMFV